METAILLLACAACWLYYHMSPDAECEPPVVDRIPLAVTIAVLCLMLAAWVMCIWFPRIAIGVLIGCTLFWLACDLNKMRWVRKARRHNLALCLDCGHVLEALPRHHECPRCGEPYHIDDVKHTWRRFGTQMRFRLFESS